MRRSSSRTSWCRITPSDLAWTWCRRGPVVAQPFAGRGDLERLRDLGGDDISHVTRTVELVVDALSESDTPLIGFAGAPFTVASYLVEGGPTRDFGVIKSLMHADPQLFDDLLERLVSITISFLRAQVEHGARALQLFDSWAGALSRDEYERFALQATRRCSRESRISTCRPYCSAWAPVSCSTSWPGRAARSWHRLARRPRRGTTKGR